MTFSRINIMLPTYKRMLSGKLPHFIESAVSMAKDRHNLCLSVLVNDDDMESIQYFMDHGDDWGVPLCMLFEPPGRPHLGRFFNRLFDETKFNDDDTLVSMLGDDMVFDTPGWDEIVLQGANERQGWGIFYGEDCLIHHEKLCVNLFTSRPFVRATGKPFMCPRFACDWIDSIWMDAMTKMGTAFYIPSLKIRHEHARKVGSDETWDRLSKEYVDISRKQEEYEWALSYVNEIVAALVRNRGKFFKGEI